MRFIKFRLFILILVILVIIILFISKQKPPVKREVVDLRHIEKKEKVKEPVKIIPGRIAEERMIIEKISPEIPDWIKDYVRSDSVIFSTIVTINGDGEIIFQELKESTGIFELDNLLLKTIKDYKYNSSGQEITEREIRITYEF